LGVGVTNPSYDLTVGGNGSGMINVGNGGNYTIITSSMILWNNTNGTGIRWIDGNHQIKKDGNRLEFYSWGDPGADAYRFYTQGTTNIRMKITDTGLVYADGAYTGTGADYAEIFKVVDLTIESGDVLIMDTNNQGILKKCDMPNTTTVVGVVSDNPCMIGGNTKGAESTGLENDERIVGLMGVVKTKVSCTNGKISIGDLLVASSVPGHAMKGVDPKPGTIIGKALEPLETGTGKIKVLVTIH
jgi:hypothetical protein